MSGENRRGGDHDSRYALRSNKTPTLKRNSVEQVPESSSRSKRAKEMEALFVKEAGYDTRFHAPPPCNKENPRSLEFEKLCRKYVEAALKSFNKSKKAKKVGEYELVEVGDVSGCQRGMEGYWYHTNFKDKPKNAPEAESELFFAELKKCYAQSVRCVKCCILGPMDGGTRGCKACEKFFPKLGHPQDGFHIGFPSHRVAYRPTDKGACRS
uniref:DUF3615 domain-containing protein n=1 Tax=Opuntia streptacantha TaxID=393608 RepID=A0A7C8ZQS8_OPUST